MSSIEIKNLESIIKSLESKNKNVMQEITKALYMEAEGIMRASKEKYVPVKTSTLKTSGFVNLPKISSTAIEIEMGYGGAASAYALYVHEAPANWNWSVPGTGPKYLEKPAREAAEGMGGRLATRLKSALK